MSPTSPASPASSPLVTAVVVNWNGGEMTLDAIESLFAQTHSRLDVILVDNGSTDGIADLAERRYGPNGRFRVLRNQKNEGFARANNQAMQAARGDWVFLLNNDAVAEPRCVEEALAVAATYTDAGMLACRVMRKDAPNFFDSAGLLIYPDGICRPRAWEEKDVGQYDRVEEVLAPHGCAAFYRKEMLVDVEGFDEAYFCYLEDLDLGMRGQLCGWRCYYAPASVVMHKKSATAGNYSKFKAYHVERNRIWNALKLMPPFILAVSPLFTMNRYLLQGYAAATHQGLSADFVKEYTFAEQAVLLTRAYLSAFLRAPEMWAKRRALEKRRRLSREEWYRLISRFKLDAIEIALKF